MSEEGRMVLTDEAARELQKLVDVSSSGARQNFEIYANNCDVMSRLLRTMVSNLTTGRAAYGDLVEMCTAYRNLSRNKEVFAEAMMLAQNALTYSRVIDESNMMKALETSGVGAMQALEALKGKKK